MRFRERFLYVCEAPDDAGGTAVDDPGDGGADEPEFHSIFTQEGWAARAGGEAPEPEADDDPDPPAGELPVPPEPPAAPAVPEGWDEADWAQFQKEYPGRTPAQLWSEHKNLRTLISRGEHKNPPAEPAPEPEGPPTWTAQDYSALGPIPQDGLTMIQREQLGSLMQADPKAAAHWAAANAHLLNEQEFAAVQSNWYQADPYGATMAWRQAEAEREQERLQAEYGPRMETVDLSQQRAGIALVEQAIPDFATHKADFSQWIEQNPEIDQYLATFKTPEEVRDALTVVYYQWYGPNLAERLRVQQAEQEAARVEAERQAAEAQAAAEAANRNARTATRSAPTPTQGAGEASDEDIRAAIRNARR
jgi:hypothetical protein